MILFILKLIIFFFPTKTKCNLANTKDSPLESKLEITFTSSHISDEYIVMFNGYYRPNTRAKYIRAGLEKTKVKNCEILQRSNLSQIFPSDFDILHCKLAKGDVEILASHPVIRTVTRQHYLYRTLNYVTTPNISKDVDSHWNRHVLRAVPEKELIESLNANELWKKGITGVGVKVAIFDTGLALNHPHFRNVKERTNWTNEKLFNDGVSHGTFVAGIIASCKECLGLAPDVELHIYKVFTNNQVSYTSWFLDAFNYAIFRKINILNLSIGGPDFMDHPFVDKVLEMSANRVIMISAIGNDGPYYGTLNNPGDQSDVIGVGGINGENKVATFSSRGMTTWELPLGYGRVKPDVVAHGSQVKSSNVFGGCRSLSGTSVASPVVAGATALILSGALNKSHEINPASIKQILIEGATRLPSNNMFEQGHGKLNILQSMELLLSYKPKITLSPPYVDHTESYMWPFNSQPLFCQSMPSIINVTILNGISVTGYILDEPVWHPYKEDNGNLLDIGILFSPILWPWVGWMSVHIFVKNSACYFEGIAKGHISLHVQSSVSEDIHSNDTIYLPLSIKIIPKPPRHKRILWDQFHNLRYPPGYIPRDNLKIKSDPLDWRGDHLHTNFRDMYQHLRNLGYYVEVLREPFTCFNASNYGALLIVDPEEEFFNEEILKLQNDVFSLGLGLIVFADWYNTTVMRKITFFDENTRQWWVPDTGGANVPALNDLLQAFGIALSDFVGEGYYRLGEHNMFYASGTTLKTFPKHDDNIVIAAHLNDQGDEFMQSEKKASTTSKVWQPVIGMFQMHANDKKNITFSESWQTNYFEDASPQQAPMRPSGKETALNKRILLKLSNRNKFSESNVLHHNKKKQSQLKKSEMGRLAIIGDSNCIDSIHVDKPCLWLLNAFLEYVINSHKALPLKKQNHIKQYALMQQQQKHDAIVELPKRLMSSNLYKFSKVLDSTNQHKKRSIEECQVVQFATVQPIHTSEATKLMKYSFPRKEPRTQMHLINQLAHNDQSLYVVNDFQTITIFAFVALFVIFMLYLKKFKRRRIQK